MCLLEKADSSITSFSAARGKMISIFSLDMHSTFSWSRIIPLPMTKEVARPEKGKRSIEGGG